MDVSITLTAIVLLSPLFALASVLILVKEGRPIFFRQMRVGKHGKPFALLKFRSMEAGQRGCSVTARGDARITRIGIWLRTYKIDELPQLVNVLQGNMSLIGPRPEVPEYVDAGSELWRSVLEMEPGITDASTLAFRDEEEILLLAPDPSAYYRSVVLPEKLRLTLSYQKARTLMLDLKLLTMTARYSLFPRGFQRERVLRSLAARPDPLRWATTR